MVSPLPVGTRVEMVGTMPDEPNPVEIGAQGTVVGGTDVQVWVEWDNNGSTLMLLPRVDPYRVI